jgi:hypothetical protein
VVVNADARGVAALLLAPFVYATGCDWTTLDAVEWVAESEETGPSDAMVAKGDARDEAGIDAGASDASSGGDSLHRAPVDAGEDADASTSAACGPEEQVLEEWTFDASVSNWTISAQSGVQATLAWTGAVGEPSPGSLDVEITPRTSDAGTTSGAWPQYGMTLGNLSGRTVSAWVWLESGPSPQVKLFVQTGTEWVWADNGTVHLSPNVWTCVSLPVSSPSYSGENYDPTDVIRLGFELLGVDSFRVYIDTVRIY